MIIGEKEILKALDGLATADIAKGVKKGLSLVQEDAKANCRYDTGELGESILTDVKEKKDSVWANCYTDKKHAHYVEFGTGPKGQADHKGISPEVPVVYRQTPWGIPESEIDKKTAEKYHFFSIETKEGVFYRTSGQPAHPFLYPALKDNEDKVMKIIIDEARKDLEKV